MNRIFLVGYMGSGKSAMGRLLAKRLGYSFVDLDHYIEGKYHKTIAQLFQEEGESAFREKEKLCLREVGEFENTVIATGGGAPCFFDSMEYMNQQGVTIYLKLSPGELVTRLLKGKAGVRPLLTNKTPEELLDFITTMLQKRTVYYEKSRHVIQGNDSEIIDQVTSFEI